MKKIIILLLMALVILSCNTPMVVEDVRSKQYVNVRNDYDINIHNGDTIIYYIDIQSRCAQYYFYSMYSTNDNIFLSIPNKRYNIGIVIRK
jgi:hypothetical protein